MPRTAVDRLAALLPRDFSLGVATAAFQIEGAVDDDGRGPSGWDEFARKPGTIAGGASPAVAADHYHRMEEDIGLVERLGVDAYRLSISWPRVQPDGRGPWNEKGWAFYDRLLDVLLAAGIRPVVTLYHWDTPLPLEHDGGWLARATAERFADYAAEAGRRFGDRVSQWVTVNEPVTVTLNGYGLGIHAPGRELLFGALPCVHHQLLAHGLAAQALRAAGVVGGVGITNLHAPVFPKSRHPLDRLHAGVFDLIFNRLYADPVLLGRYPRIPWLARRDFRPLAAAIRPGDLRIIRQPLDFYGLNYYYPMRIAAGSGPGSAASTGHHSHLPALKRLPFHLAEFPEFPRTGFGWPIAPGHIAIQLAELRRRYGPALPPIVVTENGASFPEPDRADTPIDDGLRIGYLASHLEAALLAVRPGGPAEGVRLLGWFVWTLLDNFEWAAGYSQRFGLVHVDFETLERTPKASYEWLRRLNAARR
ncbi:family 1 glycosylhydrolase [Sinomonas sp. JGH33]|uniref:beta-glucosidase n=1 Tax=Sinomonas terricola TaxID=3110330 RepID=A0ABU5T1F5_9MICC|nr:family 1 glycosylhydrolase [Sinomonas sp. JGH33]MEA5453481.1 family 1 glycosylhydrolase [Sinomonas sp. JGH33]